MVETGVTMAAVTDDTILFRQLVSNELDEAFRVACLILGDRLDAEDAVQDALLSAWAARGSLREPDRFGAWFGRIVVNKCRDRRRSPFWSRRLRVAVAEAPPAIDPVRGDLEIVERDAIRRALSTLDTDHRTVVVLRFFADLSVEEIAARTGARTGTVKSRLHYALASLRAAFDAAGDARTGRPILEETSR